MKAFHCDVCAGPACIENNQCTRCGLEIGYFPDRNQMAALQSAHHRPCRNHDLQRACNWMLRAEDPAEYCLSCRLNRAIPDLASAPVRAQWRRAEAAKRRLIHGLLALGLPVVGKDIDEEQGLAFEFCVNGAGTDGDAVIAAHAGVIRMNIAARDEGTPLGWLRHQAGHYYWSLLVRDSERLADFRRVFGDERASGSSSHPWQVWAETWAQYLQITDSLETASAAGMTWQAPGRPAPAGRVATLHNANEFASLISGWNSLTSLLNNLNHGNGLEDACASSLPEPALAKLRFIHELVSGEEPRVRKRAA